MNELLTAPELSRYLGVTRARIHQLTKAGVFPTAIFLGHRWFYPAELVGQCSETWPDGTKRRKGAS